MLDILDKIKSCIKSRRILWTYHVTMRMADRAITRRTVLDAVQSYEVLEMYPDDKYMPSCLLRGELNEMFFHIACAFDVENDNVRIISAYRPSPEKWDAEGRRRVG